MTEPLAGDFDFRREVSQYDLVQDSPVEDWQLGLPVGNGVIGAMLWGGPRQHFITLNRSDLWDLKWDDPWMPGFDLARVRKLWEAGDMEQIQKVHDYSCEVYDRRQCCFQPAGRVCLELQRGSGGGFSERLHLYEGLVEADCGAAHIEMFAPPGLPVVVLRIEAGTGGTARISVNRPLPADGRYPPPSAGGTEDAIWLEQQLPDSPLYRMAVFPLEGTVRREGDAIVVQGGRTTVLALSVVMGQTAARFEEVRREVSRKDWRRLLNENIRWWAEFWSKSFVQYPDPIATNVWFMSLYLLGSCSRKPGYPPNLQGIWSDWDWPNWHCDYHHDLNTEMNYWGIDAANHGELGQVFYDFWKARLPQIKDYTRKYYGLPGIRIPATTEPKARELGGFFPVVLWVGSSAWVVYHYWLYYIHTLDEDFLRDTCYPMLSEQARFCAAYLQRDHSGRPFIFPSHSPEQGGGTPEAIGTNSVIDLWLFRTTFENAARAAQILDVDANERDNWRALARQLPDYPTEDGVLIDMEGRRYRKAHRHLSILSPIYPGSRYHRHSPSADRELAYRSYREFTSRPRFGNILKGDYCHFTPQWLSIVAARLGLAGEAMGWMQCFLADYILPNGMSTIRPFRLPGVSPLFQIDCNGGHVAAVNEALMQSHAGAIDVFPGVPQGHAAAFYSLRARGAFLVSARRSEQGVEWVHIVSEKGGTARVFTPWPARSVLLNGRSLKADDGGVLSWETSPNSQWLLVPQGGTFDPLRNSAPVQPGLLWRKLRP